MRVLLVVLYTTYGRCFVWQTIEWSYSFGLRCFYSLVQKSSESVPSTRYLRALSRAKTTSAPKLKCCKQPSTEASGEKAEGDDAIDFTETIQGENERESVASCSRQNRA